MDQDVGECLHTRHSIIISNLLLTSLEHFFTIVIDLLVLP